MCLAVPVKVVSVEGETATVDAGGGNLVRTDLSLVDDVRPGDYVLLHAGFAIQKYDPSEAEETLRLLRSMLPDGEEGEGHGH